MSETIQRYEVPLSSKVLRLVGSAALVASAALSVVFIADNVPEQSREGTISFGEPINRQFPYDEGRLLTGIAAGSSAMAGMFALAEGNRQRRG